MSLPLFAAASSASVTSAQGSEKDGGWWSAGVVSQAVSRAEREMHSCRVHSFTAASCLAGTQSLVEGESGLPVVQVVARRGRGRVACFEANPRRLSAKSPALVREEKRGRRSGDLGWRAVECVKLSRFRKGTRSVAEAEGQTSGRTKGWWSSGRITSVRVRWPNEWAVAGTKAVGRRCRWKRMERWWWWCRWESRSGGSVV